MGLGVAQVLMIILFSISVSGSELNCVYSVYVRTGQLFASGTDSRITLSLYDADGYGLRIKNLEAWGGIMGEGHDYFEFDNLDMFTGRGPCLNGPICKMNLTSDGTGQHPGWYCNYVQVTSTGEHKRCNQQLFTVEKWLGADVFPDGLTAIKNNCRRTYNEQLSTYDSQSYDHVVDVI
ncbi:unnamed protein product [Withania somnifera]